MAVNVLLIQTLTVVYYALSGYYWLLIINIFLSWIPELKQTKIGRLITYLADPYMRIFRGLLVFGMFDFTPIIGLILYQIGVNYFGQMINIMINSL